jgi:ribosome biogenesis GTPase A
MGINRNPTEANKGAKTNIQWFPGHMAKARRLLAENLSKVDAVVELLDARAPLSSENPEIDKLLKNKPRVVAANKSDLADPAVTAEYVRIFKERGIRLIPVDSRSGAGTAQVREALFELMAEKLSRKAEKGLQQYTIKTMVVGIPNVGKSTFINRLLGRNKAVTGDRPGVTRGEQWLRVDDRIVLLDTPGLLWPRFDDQRTGFVLSCAGSIKDDVTDRSEIASFLLLYLLDNYKGVLADKYGVDEAAALEEDADGLAADNTVSRLGMVGFRALEEVALKNGCLRKGGVADVDRASAKVLDDLRAGRLGRISLDLPEGFER